MQILKIGFLIRIIVAYINIYIFAIPGLNEDAQIFHDLAVDFSRGNYVEDFYYYNSHYFYSHFLSFFYFLFFESKFLGCFINIILWYLSAVFLFKILFQLKTSAGNISLALMIYSFVPTSIFFSSATFREPIMLFAINLIIYLALKIHFSKNFLHIIFFKVIIIGICIFLSNFIHVAFNYISFVIIFTILSVIVSKFINIKFFYLFIFFLLFALMLFANLNLININENINLIEASSAYRQNTTIGDTSYNINISDNSIINSLYVFFQFMVQPLFNNNLGFLNIIVIVENLLRIFAFSFLIFKINLRHQKFHSFLINIFFSALFIYFIWSQGTTNWGTAIRHSFPELGMLLIVLFGGLKKNFLKNFF